jgi:outer membrane protein TolC
MAASRQRRPLGRVPRAGWPHPAMNPITPKPSCRRPALWLTGVALLTGCASFSPDGGFGPVEQAAQEKLSKDLRWSRGDADQAGIDQRVGELLAQPLSADDAVQVALLNNRGLQARFQEIGIGQADLVQADRLPNPGFSFSRLQRGGELEIERGIHVQLARLITLPRVGAMEARRFEATQVQVTLAMLSLAADTRKAWVNALAAEETLRYMRQVGQAAEAGAELARRMEQAGNFSKLQRAREQGFQADAALNLARAEQAQRATRERLVRLLGLGDTPARFSLPPRLPDLPSALADRPDIERLALAQRLDLRLARLQAEQTARQLGLTKTTRFINVLELGAVRNSASDAAAQTGWEIGFELPLFDGGEARVARAQAVYMQALHRVAEAAITARSEVREAQAAWRTAHDIARRHQDEIVPLRQQIAEENLRRYNGMLIGVFDLLADARLQIASVNAAIEAKRDFWLAQADLDMALVGRPVLAPPSGPVPLAGPGGEAAH